MRCSRRFCVENAVDRTNYCELHLKARGTPRPGISNTRSASGVHASMPSKVKLAAAVPPSGEQKKQAGRSPVLLGQASILATSAAEPVKKKARTSSSGTTEKAIQLKSKARKVG